LHQLHACMLGRGVCMLSAFRCRLSLVCVHACLHALEYPLCLQAHRVSLTLTRFVVCRPLSPRDTDRRCMLTWVAMCYLFLARHVRACMRSQLRPPTNPSQQSADHLVSFRTCSEQVTCINFHTRVSSHCRGCVHHVSTVVHNCSCCDCSGSATNRVRQRVRRCSPSWCYTVYAPSAERWHGRYGNGFSIRPPVAA
jgi:hypothetical protein